jgi:outer membrane immunogenic protein
MGKLERLLLIAFLTVSAPAWAADFPATVEAYEAIPSLNWSGFYLGVNGGFGFGHGKASGSYGGFSVSAAQDIPGGLAGGQFGYNWQAGHMVFGLEADAQYSSQERDTLLCPASACGADVNLKNKLPWFATARGRIGYAFAQYLVYGTGGFAYAGLSSTLSASAGGASTDLISWSEARPAWTIGGGVEFAITRGWSAKFEYLYLDTGSFNASVNVPVAGIVTPTIHVTDQIVRAGVNYHF